MQEDSQIIEYIRKNRREGQKMLLSLYKPRVHNLIAGIVSDCQDIEELTQDTFLKVFDSISHFNPSRGTLATWIYHIAYNTAVSFVTQWHPLNILPINDNELDISIINDAWLDQELSCEKEEQIQALENAVSGLPPEERLLITLYYYEGCTIADISRIISASPNAVYHRLQRIRKKLYIILKGQ